jgi:hypothetical protein
MLMVPTFPGPVGTGAAVAGAVEAGVDVGAAALDGVAALPVWAKAENVNVAAIASTTLRNLLFIGLVELLGTWFHE